MFCGNCGYQLAEGNRFCGNCGASTVSEQTVAKPQQQSQPQPRGRCTVGDLERVYQMSYSMMKQHGAPADLLNMLEATLSTLKESFNEQAVGFCLGKYIDSELDCSTKGDRGLGRMTTYVPRLGGHYRKQIAALSSAERDTLFTLIQDMMLQGYLANATLEFDDKGVFAEKSITDSEGVFNKWIPLIYSYDFDEFDQVIGNFTYSGWERIRDFFEAHKMKVGDNKTKEILTYYMLAGFALRFSEA